MKVIVIDQQRTVCVDGRRIERLANLFMDRVLDRKDGVTWDSVIVVLVDDAVSQQINMQFLRHDYATDVISFKYGAVPGGAGGMTGEIVVNAELAWRIGPRHGGAGRELALYVAHGCDHLGGANDATPTERRRMRARENRWLRAPRARALIRGVVDTSRRRT